MDRSLAPSGAAPRALAPGARPSHPVPPMFHVTRLRRALLPAVLGAAAIAAAPAEAATQPFEQTVRVSCTSPTSSVQPLSVTISGRVPTSTAPGEEVRVTDLDVSLEVGIPFTNLPVPGPPSYPVMDSSLDALSFSAVGATPAELSALPAPLALPRVTELTGTSQRLYRVDVPQIPSTSAGTTAGSAPVVLRFGSLTFRSRTGVAGDPPLTLNAAQTCTTEPALTPLAIIKSTGEIPAAPVVESVSPSSGALAGGERVTIKGRNLGSARGTSGLYGSPVTVVDDTTIQVTAPQGYAPTTVEVGVISDFGTSTPNPAATYTWKGDGESAAPTVPSGLKVAGNGPSATLTWTASTDRFGPVSYDVFQGTRFLATVPATTYTVSGLTPNVKYTFSVRARGPLGNLSAFSNTVDYTAFVACAGCGATVFDITGSATLKTLTKGTLPLRGRTAFDINLDTGAISTDLVIDPTSARLTALGFIPVTAKVSFVSASKTTGALSESGLALKSLVRLKLPEIKLFGTIPLAGGTTCQTRSFSTIDLTDPAFDLLDGGTLKGTFAISDLSGCGALNGLVSPLTAGGGNTIKLALTPKR